MKSLNLVLCLSMGFSGFIAAEDWPFFRGPNRNGIAAMKFNPVEDPEIIWKEDVGNGGEWGGAPVIANGRLYIHGGRDSPAAWVSLLCLDAKTGAEIWQSERYPRTDTAPSIHLASGRIFTIDGQRYVRCFDAKSGREIWKADQLPESTGRRSWGHSGSPTLWEDLVIVNVGYGAALKQSTGEVAWQFDGYSGMATPVLFQSRGKPSVAIFCGDKCVGRDVRTGRELWSIPWKTNSGVNAADPVIFEGGNKVFLSSGYGLGRALYDVSSGTAKELWNKGENDEFGAHSWFSALYHDGNLYMMTREGIACVNQANGSLHWRKGPRGYLMNLGGRFVLSGWKGELMLFNLSRDAIEETFRGQVAGGETWNSPAYADGLLYTRSKGGGLYCARISR